MEFCHCILFNSFHLTFSYLTFPCYIKQLLAIATYQSYIKRLSFNQMFTQITHKLQTQILYHIIIIIARRLTFVQ